MLRSETAQDPPLRHAALRGLAQYQAAPRPPAEPPRATRATAGRVTLYDGGGTGRPVLLIPSLINPPDILDMPGRSLLGHIAAAGHDALLLDWGMPEAADGALDLAQHIEHFLLPLIAAMPEPPVLIGYCLGGTLAVAAAACAPVAGVACVAAPWRFDGYPSDARADMTRMWHETRGAAAALGVLPMETLQAGFWQLDPTRTIAKFAQFAELAPDSHAARAFVALEDWANAGPPLPYGVARELFEDFIGADLPGRNRWRVGEHIVDPAALGCPTIGFASTTDRIVPQATAPQLDTMCATTAGHVGMMIGRGAQDGLHRPLADWIGALPRPT